MGSLTLSNAKNSGNDEFYVQYEYIEKEINAYLEYDENVFEQKTVFLPCNDLEWSNFTKFFAQSFNRLHLRKLITTSYAPANKSDLGKIYMLESDANGDGRADIKDLLWSDLMGDGDFRSDEVIKIRDEVDVIVTCPPFSLFNDFLKWLIDSEKQFAIIANMNSLTYTNVFPLIRTNRVWLGASLGDMVFAVPPGTQIKDSDRKKAKSLGYDGDFTRFGNFCWLTNIDHGRRHKPLSLMTMAENRKYNKNMKGSEYQKYDNYNAIEVPRVDAIPSDYGGIMGVPVSFLLKYNSDQFKIIGMDFEVKYGRLSQLARPEWKGKMDRAYLSGNRLYSRLFIQHK